ncbi:MAG: glutamate synthase subunit alpha, partial [Deltaproteobacteria bacterium]
FRKLDDMVGRVDCLVQRKDVDHWKAKGINLSTIVYTPPLPGHVARRKKSEQDHGIERSVDVSLIGYCKQALDEQTPVNLSLPIANVNRSVGTMLSGEIARRYGGKGLPEDTIRIQFKGSAGQSFGAFLAPGVTLELEGEANDYMGKGLSGGRVIVYPPRQSEFVPEENILVGNVCLYGATSGEVFLNGMAGERFAVRASGVTAVVEGVGDHGCEYMTKGLVVVLGKTGRNFAAGMNGGIAFVLDPTGSEFASIKCNRRSVDLEPVTDPKDIETLFGLISRHSEYTGSPQARWILENWDSAVAQFVKVFPHEYKRVLGVPLVSGAVLEVAAKKAGQVLRG